MLLHRQFLPATDTLAHLHINIYIRPWKSKTDEFAGQGYESLEAKLVMGWYNPPPISAEVDFSKKKVSDKWVCPVCGHPYNPAGHNGTAFEELPGDWKGRCKQGKEKCNKA